ncbi:MAG: hypothetical protein WCT12_20830 [Verrucomicrobiota bacterium]|jgi:hypothetical protein
MFTLGLAMKLCPGETISFLFGLVRLPMPAGILANNVVSDPVSCLLHLWADQALLTPRFAPDINVSRVSNPAGNPILLCKM